jgi:hypothetical protein
MINEPNLEARAKGANAEHFPQGSSFFELPSALSAQCNW